MPGRGSAFGPRFLRVIFRAARRDAARRRATVTRRSGRRRPRAGPGGARGHVIFFVSRCTHTTLSVIISVCQSRVTSGRSHAAGGASTVERAHRHLNAYPRPTAARLQLHSHRTLNTPSLNSPSPRVVPRYPCAHGTCACHGRAVSSRTDSESRLCQWLASSLCSRSAHTPLIVPLTASLAAPLVQIPRALALHSREVHGIHARPCAAKLVDAAFRD